MGYVFGVKCPLGNWGVLESACLPSVARDRFHVHKQCMCGRIQHVSSAYESVLEAKPLLGLMQVNGFPFACPGVFTSSGFCDQLMGYGLKRR